MLQVTSEKKVLSLLDDYFGMVGKTGYVKYSNIRKFLLYLFLVDFVEFTHDYFTREDYDTVGEALSRLFANGGCLLPYPVFCANRATIGRAHYMGSLRLRITEDPLDNLKRVTEDDILRVMQ